MIHVKLSCKIRTWFWRWIYTLRIVVANEKRREVAFLSCQLLQSNEKRGGQRPPSQKNGDMSVCAELAWAVKSVESREGKGIVFFLDNMPWASTSNGLKTRRKLRISWVRCWKDAKHEDCCFLKKSPHATLNTKANGSFTHSDFSARAISLYIKLFYAGRTELVHTHSLLYRTE